MNFALTQIDLTRLVGFFKAFFCPRFVKLNLQTEKSQGLTKNLNIDITGVLPIATMTSGMKRRKINAHAEGRVSHRTPGEEPAGKVLVPEMFRRGKRKNLEAEEMTGGQEAEMADGIDCIVETVGMKMMITSKSIYEISHDVSLLLKSHLAMKKTT